MFLTRCADSIPSWATTRPDPHSRPLSLSEGGFSLLGDLPGHPGRSAGNRSCPSRRAFSSLEAAYMAGNDVLEGAAGGRTLEAACVAGNGPPSSLLIRRSFRSRLCGG